MACDAFLPILLWLMSPRRLLRRRITGQVDHVESALNAVNTMLGTTIDNAARTAAGIRSGRTRPLQRRPQPPSRKTGSDPGPAGDCLPCVKRRALAADET